MIKNIIIISLDHIALALDKAQELVYNVKSEVK
jgi:hypothetical protein